MTRPPRARSAFIRFALPFGALGFFALAALPARAQVDASIVPDDAPAWQPMAAAIDSAKTDDRLLLIHTYAKWCGWCARLDQEVYTDDAVQAYLGEHFAVTRLDMEAEDPVRFFGMQQQQRELAASFGVTGTPTILFFDAEGRYITRYPGYAPPDRFLYLLRYVKEGAYELMPFPDFIEMAEHADQRGG
ncbi:MAG TPA: thioredoxin fold domain-containing protein [Rubricoccaceae bacterium]|nr:thioredoxin fold domain-containing protein [Rubricoccaceae bacterium]